MATFGKTTNGANSSATTSDRKRVSSASPSNNGTLQSLKARIWVSANSTPARGVVYLDSGGSPGALYAVTDEVTINNTTEQELIFPFSGANLKSVTAGTTYWIGVFYQAPSGGASFNISRDNTAAQSIDRGDTYSDGAADPFGAGTVTTGPIDVHVEYQLSSGASAFFSFFP